MSPIEPWVISYLSTNVPGRGMWGKADVHIEMAIAQVEAWGLRRNSAVQQRLIRVGLDQLPFVEGTPLWRVVHDHSQKLTNHLDTMIGWDVADLEPRFKIYEPRFIKAWNVVMEELTLSADWQEELKFHE